MDLVCIAAGLVFFFALCALLVIVTKGQLTVPSRNVEGFTDDTDPLAFSIADLNLSQVSETWMSDSVPLIIHQIAPKEKEKWHHLWHPCQETWLEKFPEFSYRIWHDEDIDNLIADRFPKFLPIYKSYPKNIHRFDIVRYFILYEYGGIYADMDMECVNNFFNLLPVGKVSIAESAIPGELYQNALMAAPARHPYWHYVLNDAICFRNTDFVLTATGPGLIFRVANVVPPNMFHALPFETFAVDSYPQRDKHSFKKSMRSDIYSIHHGSCVYCT